MKPRRSISFRTRAAGYSTFLVIGQPEELFTEMKDEDSDPIQEFLFATKEELDAFLLGLEAAYMSLATIFTTREDAEEHLENLMKEFQHVRDDA